MVTNKLRRFMADMFPEIDPEIVQFTRPLKPGVLDDAMSVIGDRTWPTRKHVNEYFGWYTTQPEYIHSVSLESHRWDLKGNKVMRITRDHRLVAQGMLQGLRIAAKMAAEEGVVRYVEK